MLETLAREVRDETVTFSLMARPFLTAEWRYLAMVNCAVDPALLAPLVPNGTELDFYRGETFLSVVGFLFLNTRVLGLPIPRHRDFEEVNLRFYVRRRSVEGWRRGVVFVRELVPRRAVALVARTFYGEPYSAVPMRHVVEHQAQRLAVSYSWWRDRRWETLAMTATGEPKHSATDSHEEFITEHYWGYTKRPLRTNEYRVEHERWRFWPAKTWRCDMDAAALYGASFAPALNAPPASAFIAEGSSVVVRRRTRETFQALLPPD